MDAEKFIDTLRTTKETELSRLGSSKSLYAATEGEMEPAAVLRAAATAEHHAAETFAGWADGDADPDAATAWEQTAAEEREHYETVLAELDGAHDPGEVPAVHARLRAAADTVERAGGFVGRVLASDASKGQITGFFTGQADPATASLFRELRSDLDGQLDRARAVLSAACEDEADWARAEEAAAAAVDAAYEEYVDSLESMGVDPKPVC
jgi:hypothetical protein